MQQAHTMAETTAAQIGILTVSDRASAGLYQDESGPAIEQFLRDTLTSPWSAIRRVVPDGVEITALQMTVPPWDTQYPSPSWDEMPARSLRS
jgi:molybdopterin biosynthesis enzyme MoaB